MLNALRPTNSGTKKLYKHVNRTTTRSCAEACSEEGMWYKSSTHFMYCIHGCTHCIHVCTHCIHVCTHCIHTCIHYIRILSSGIHDHLQDGQASVSFSWTSSVSTHCAKKCCFVYMPCMHMVPNCAKKCCFVYMPCMRIVPKKVLFCIHAMYAYCAKMCHCMAHFGATCI